MKCKLFALTAFSVLMSLSSFAQTQIKAQADVGGAYNELLSDICLSDNGFLLAGTSFSDHSKYKTQNSWGANDYWVIKFAEDKITGKATIQWDETIGGDKDDTLIAARSTRDGGYILAGNSYSGISGNKTVDITKTTGIWLVKLNADGSIAWQKTVGSALSQSDRAYDMDTTDDGGCILTTNSGLIKTDQYGNIQWINNAVSNDGAAYTSETLDKGYIVTSPFGEIQKTDSLGNILWRRDYDTIVECRFKTQCTKDSGFIMCGVYVNYSESVTNGDGRRLRFKLIVHKLDKAGNLLWTTIADETKFSASFDISILQTSDGGYLVGSTTNHGGGYQYYTLKLNSAGSPQWSKIVDGSSSYLKDLKELRPNIYLLGGISSSGIAGDKTKKTLGGFDYWPVVLADTTAKPSLIKNITMSDAVAKTKSFIVYPNPVKDVLHINTNTETNISLINQQGIVVFTQQIKNTRTINISKLPAGIYYVKDNRTGEVQKIVISK